MTYALLCLALNIYHESRGEPISDQVATAQTVLARVNSPWYPDTVCEVVRQRGRYCQFTWVCESIPKYDARAWTQSQLIASAVLDGSGHADFHATHYHAKRVNPNWGLIPLGGYGGDHVYYVGG